MSDPKRRDPAALRARQRQRQAGGPHDEGRTRGEEERMAIDEQWEPLSVREARRTLAEWEAGWDGRESAPQAVRDAWARLERWEEQAAALDSGGEMGEGGSDG